LFWHVCPEGQVLPQDPQFPLSFRRSRHVPLQEVWPEGHEPFVPAAVAAVVPVAIVPLLLLFWLVDELNCPLMQVSPKGTEKPHAPQLSWSVLRSTHFPLQGDWPAEHWPMTGIRMDPWDVPVVFVVPACSGMPGNTKNAIAAIRRIMPIKPSTRTGESAILGRSVACLACDGGDRLGFATGLTGGERGGCGESGTTLSKGAPQDLQKSSPLLFELPH
jgi:hypothetical protein